MKVSFNLVHPTHYYQYLIDKIQQDKSIHVEVVYFSGLLSNYPWKEKIEINANVYFLKKILSIDLRFLFKSRKDELPIIAGWVEPTMLLLIAYWYIIGKPYVLLTDTVSPRKSNGFRENLRKYWLENVIFKGACAILTTGEVGVRALKSYNVGISKLFNFPFVTNLELFKPNKSKKQSDKSLVIFSSGRLDIAHKGYDKALIALSNVKKRFPKLEFKYLIGGVGPDKELIENLIIKLGLIENVELLGWLEVAELPEIISNADLFLHPSNFDPYPNAVLEAMACGIPVLGSSLAGSAADRIVPGQNGLIHHFDDINDLTRNLIVFIEMSLEDRNMLGIKARETAEKWTYHHNIKVLKKIVTDLSK